MEPGCFTPVFTNITDIKQIGRNGKYCVLETTISCNLMTLNKPVTAVHMNMNQMWVKFLCRGECIITRYPLYKKALGSFCNIPLEWTA